jgi:hypothetical protein
MEEDDYKKRNEERPLPDLDHYRSPRWIFEEMRRYQEAIKENRPITPSYLEKTVQAGSS